MRKKEKRVSKGKKRESATGIRGYRERGKLKTRQQFEKVQEKGRKEGRKRGKKELKNWNKR